MRLGQNNFWISSNIVIARLLTGGAFTVLASLASANAFANDATAQAGPAAPTAAAPKQADAADNGEIVVTAQRQSQSLLNVPIAITAVTGAQLAQKQINDVQALSLQTPGLNYAKANGRTSIAVRGVSAPFGTTGFESSIGQYLDGVYQQAQGFGDLGFLDLERVEVLKGPQGALYGRNATGGAINYISAAPTDKLEGYVRGLIGDYDLYRVEGAISGPITQGLDFRISAFENSFGGYYLNLQDGHHVGSDHAGGVRVRLRWAPTPSLTINVIGDRIRDDHGFIENAITPLGPNVAYMPAIYTAPRTLQPFRVYSDIDTIGYNHHDSASVNANWNVADNISVTALGAWTRTALAYTTDCDTTGYAECLSPDLEKDTDYQGDLYTQGKFLDEKLHVLVGFSYFHSSSDGGNVSELTPAGAVFNFLTLPQGTLNPGLLKQKVRSYSIYTDDTYNITDHLTVSGGARFTSDRKDGIITDGLSLPIPGVPFMGCTDFVPDPSKSNKTTFKAGAEYHFDRNTMAYFSFNQGFKNGGFNASCSPSYKPESINSYEVGLKGKLFSGAVVYQADAFLYDYNNLQVAQIVGLVSQVQNAASATGKGFELSVNATATRALSFDGNLSLLDAHYSSYCTFAQVSPEAENAPLNCPAGPSHGTNLAGDQLNKAPHFTGSMGVNLKETAGDIGDFTFRGEIYHSASVYYDPFHDAGTTQRPYTIGNIIVSVVPQAASFLTLRGFVKNVSNTIYKEQVFTLGYVDTEAGTYSPPRTYGVELTASF